jgi:hypothetical protein
MDRRFCQVIEEYRIDGRDWITLWDLADRRQIPYCLHTDPELTEHATIGQLVLARGDPPTRLFHIEENELPDHVKPLVRLPPDDDSKDWLYAEFAAQAAELPKGRRRFFLWATYYYVRLRLLPFRLIRYMIDKIRSIAD